MLATMNLMYAISKSHLELSSLAFLKLGSKIRLPQGKPKNGSNVENATS